MAVWAGSSGFSGSGAKNLVRRVSTVSSPDQNLARNNDLNRNQALMVLQQGWLTMVTGIHCQLLRASCLVLNAQFRLTASAPSSRLKGVLRDSDAPHRHGY